MNAGLARIKAHIKFYLLLISFLGIYNIAHGHGTEKIYSIGVVPQFETRRLYTIWQPILAQLQKDTGLTFKLLGSPSISEFEKELINGKFDFAYMNPYQLLLTQEHSAYKPLLRDHSKKLQGILVVRKDSAITDIQQLQGKILSFPSPNALAASLILRAELHNKYHLIFTPLYVKNHDSVYLNVVLKQTIAGGGVQKTLDKQSPRIRNKLRVLYRSQKIQPHPFSVHPRITTAVGQQVQQAMFNMMTSSQGRKMLAEIPILDIGPASMEDYWPLKKMNLQALYSKDK